MAVSWLVLIVGAAPSFEIGEPTQLPDMGPQLRACDAGNVNACGQVADIASRAGHPAVAERLWQRACDAGDVDRCTTDTDRCRLGVVAGCRRLEAAKNQPQMPSASALFKACRRRDRKACAYLDEQKLRKTDARFVTWKPLRKPYDDGVLVSPDGRTVLQRVDGGLNYVRGGKVVGTIELPQGYFAVTKVGVWTPKLLWFPVFSLQGVGVYRNGRFKLLPPEWQAVKNRRDCKFGQSGQLIYRRCRVEGRGETAKYRVFRMLPTSTSLTSFEVDGRAQLLGEGLKPGGMVVNLRKDKYFYTVGPKESAFTELPNFDKWLRSTHLTPSGRMLVSSGTEVARYRRRGKPKWSERILKSRFVLSGKGWLVQRNDVLKTAKRTVSLIRFEDSSGPRSPWIRADMLSDRSPFIHPHPSGFFLRGRGRGAVIRAPWGRWARGALMPQGRVKGVENPAWPKPRPKPVARFRADRFGWPVVGGRWAPDEGEVRPLSRRAIDVPGLEAALVGCADGVFAACEAIKTASPKLAGIGPVDSAIRALKCEHYTPHRCAPPSVKLPPDLSHTKHWSWSDLGLKASQVVNVELKDGAPEVWTTAWKDADIPGRPRSIAKLRRILETGSAPPLIFLEDDVVLFDGYAARLPRLLGGKVLSADEVALWGQDGLALWRPQKKKHAIISLPNMSDAKFSPDERYVATSGQRRIRVVDLNRGKIVLDWTMPAAVEDDTAYVYFTGRRRLLVCGKRSAWEGDFQEGLRFTTDRYPCARQPRLALDASFWTSDGVGVQRFDAETLQPTSPMVLARCRGLYPSEKGLFCVSEHYLSYFGGPGSALTEPVVRTPPAAKIEVGEPEALDFPVRSIAVGSANLPGRTLSVRFDDGVVRTVRMDPLTKVSAMGSLVAPSRAQPVEVVKPAGFDFERPVEPNRFDVAPFTPTTLRVFGPDGKPVAKSRAWLQGREVEGTDILELGPMRGGGHSLETLVMDEAGNLAFISVNARRGSVDVPVRLQRRDSDSFRALPVVGAGPKVKLWFAYKSLPVIRDDEGRILRPKRFAGQLNYEPEPGLVAKAELKDNAYRAEAAVATLHSPFAPEDKVDYQGRLLDAKVSKRAGRSARGNTKLALSPGRWRLTAVRNSTGEIRWEDIEIAPNGRYDVRFPGRSRRVQFTVRDLAGWPHPRVAGSDIAGRRPARWTLVGVPGGHQVRIPGAKEPIQFEVPAGEGLYSVRLALDLKKTR